MLRIKISELRNKLSRYLRLVRNGGSIQVMDRDKLIAFLIPAKPSVPGREHANDEAKAFFDEQVKLGVLRKGTGKLPAELLSRAPPGNPGALAILLEDRREGR